jgi:hypothetical protein
MNSSQISQNVHDVVKSINKETFFCDFKSCFGAPKATIKRLQEGGLNLFQRTLEKSFGRKKYFIRFPTLLTYTFNRFH